MQDFKNGELSDLEFTKMISGINESEFDLTLLKEDNPTGSSEDGDFNELDWNEARKSRNYIKAFRLINLQSWPEDIGWIDLENPGVTVFQARSETGKSVFFKACDCMCFPTRFGIQTRRSLIRRGCDTGSVEIKLSNDTVIKCEFYKTKNVFTRTDVDGNVTSYPPCNNLPDELARELGWFVNYNTKQLLNLIDDNNGRFFIQGSAKDSAEVLKVITQNRILTEASDNVTNWTKSLIEKDKEVVPALNAVRYRLQNTTYIDADKLRKEVELASAIGDAWKSCSYLDNELYILSLEVSNKPEEPADLSYLDSIMRSLEASDAMDPVLQDLESLIESKPECKVFSQATCQYVDSVLDTGEKIKYTQRSIDDVMSLVSQKPDDTEMISQENLEYAESILDVRSKVAEAEKAIEIMEKLIGLKPPAYGIDLEYLEKVVDAHERVEQASQSFVELVEALRDYVRSKQEDKAIDQRIRSLEEQLGVCPLCGSEFKKGV